MRRTVSDRLRGGDVALVAAAQDGLFQPLGAGHVAVEAVVAELEAAGYDGGYVLEQDTAILGAPPDPGSGPIEDVRRSIEFLGGIATAAAPTPKEGER